MIMVYGFNSFLITLRERYAAIFPIRREDPAPDDGEGEQSRLLALPLGINDERTDGYGKEKSDCPPN